MSIIFFIVKKWRNEPIFELDEKLIPSTSLTIIIPARNEEKNIKRCLDAVCNQNYPKELFRVIVVDDHSEDNTIKIVKSLPYSNLQLIELKDFIDKNKIQSFKKSAIETALQFSDSELIISTDADCVMKKNWLNYLSQFHEKNNYKIIAAPVNFHEENSLFEQFQSLDFMGMMGVTGAGIFSNKFRMCNGANLCYERKIFDEVNGFKGNEDKASGDDMFLMHKIAEAYPNKIGFLKNKNATVFTHAKPSIKSFFWQRIRWATKNTSYSDFNVMLINIIVFITCVNFFAAILLLPFFTKIMAIIAFITLLGKGIADFYLLRTMSIFFDRKEIIRPFIPQLFMHTTYIFVIGFAAQFFKSYTWKGRKVK